MDRLTNTAFSCRARDSSSCECAGTGPTNLCEQPMTSITAQRLLTEHGPIECPRVLIDNVGTIFAIEPDQLGTEGVTMTPAFFDIHVHGAAGHDVMEGTPEAIAKIGAF